LQALYLKEKAKTWGQPNRRSERNL